MSRTTALGPQLQLMHKVCGGGWRYSCSSLAQAALPAQRSHLLAATALCGQQLFCLHNQGAAHSMWYAYYMPWAAAIALPLHCKLHTSFVLTSRAAGLSHMHKECVRIQRIASILSTNIVCSTQQCGPRLKHCTVHCTSKGWLGMKQCLCLLHCCAGGYDTGTASGRVASLLSHVAVQQ